MKTPTPTAQVSSIVDEINSATEALQDGGVDKEAARKRALAASRNLIAALENPTETIFQHAFSGPDHVCIRVAVSLRLFHILAKKEEPVGAAELATISGAEHLFIVRIMRVLTATRFAGEAGLESYIATPLTRLMTMPPVEALVTHSFDHSFQIFAKMPSYFEKNSYKCPTDPQNAPFQFAFNTELSFFDYLAQNAKEYKEFTTFMTATKRNRPIFAAWFPVQERILDGFAGEKEDKNVDEVLLVDIGGGQGQDLEVFKEMHPNAPGRMILQDLARTFAEVKLSEGIEAMPYDFFTPQPVKGARAYFFHYVLHNWSDHLAVSILRNTASAMKPGYSKLFLKEHILPETNCPLLQTWADLHMMAGHSAGERSEKQFRELLELAGLEVVKFWYAEGNTDGVVEVMLGDTAGSKLNGQVVSTNGSSLA